MAHDHESIEYGLDEVKEVFDASVMTGTIIEIDYGADKADVEISGLGRKDNVPIFYHCGGSDTVEGGSTAFFEGDSVYVLNEKGNANPSIFDLKIIGFVDKLKVCGFQFKITRGDGTIIDDSFNPGFTIMNSETDDVTGTISYESDPSSTLYQYWTLMLDTAFEHDPNGYWVWFEEVEDSIDTQYPLRYKYDDQEKTEDLIQPGRYEVEVPYWVVTDMEYDPTVYEAPDELHKADRGSDCVDISMLGPNGVAHTSWKGTSQYYLGIGKSVDKIINVKSSIPYEVSRGIMMVGKWLHDQYKIVDFQGWDYEEEECVITGTFCLGTASGSWCIDKSMSVTFSGGSLNYECLRSDLRNISDEEIVEGSISGVNHSITASNTSPLSVTGSDGPADPHCVNVGSLMWVVFGGGMSINAIYDY